MDLDEQIENQYQWAERAVSVEWDAFEIPTRDGYFVATEAAKTTRLFSMILARVDRLDKKQNQVIGLLKIIVGCLIVIVFTLAVSA